MSIKYQTVALGNPSDLSAPKKFYMRAVNSGIIDLRALSRQISHSTSSTPADVASIIEEFLHVIPEHLSNGMRVHLGDFGTFSVKLCAPGQETEAKLNAIQVSETKLVFRPSRVLKNQMGQVTIQKM